jgi:hypothetical protein
VFQHVQAVALGFDQIGVRVPAGARLTAEAPGREREPAEVATGDRGGGQADRLRVPVVEVDADEGVACGGFGDQDVRLLERENQRLLQQQRHSGADQPQGRLEVALIRQAYRYQIRSFPLEHLLEVGVPPGPGFRRARRGAYRIAPDDGHQ